MLKKVFVLFLVGSAFFFVFSETYAVITGAVGGTIQTYPVDKVKCPVTDTKGQFIVKPNNVASPGPYLIIFSGLKRIRKGVKIKASYLTYPIPLCMTESTPSTGVPTLMIIKYGVSLK